MAFQSAFLRAVFLMVLLCGLAPDQMMAQTTGVSTSVGSEIQLLGQTAGTVFVGQIVSVIRKPGLVEVTFHVEESVRGGVGQIFTLREWAGFWPPGHSRYVPGQRVLAFLYATSGVGLSSPVHGQEGLVPVVVQGNSAPRLLDIRRLAASVVRAPGTPLPTDADGAISLNEAFRLISGVSTGEPARTRLPLRSAPPNTALGRVLASAGAFPSGTYQRAPLSAPVLRRASNGRP